MHTQNTHSRTQADAHKRNFPYVSMCISTCATTVHAQRLFGDIHTHLQLPLSWLPFTRLTVCRLKLQTVGQLRVGIKSSFGIESELWFANLLSSLASRKQVCCRFVATAGASRMPSA